MAKAMPYGQVMGLLVTATSHDDGRQRGDQGDREIQPPAGSLGILPEIKPPTSKMATA